MGLSHERLQSNLPEARQVAERLVGQEYQIQNGNDTRGVSKVLSLDGGAEHQPLDTEL